MHRFATDRPDQWYACEQPERPFDDLMFADLVSCDTCLLKAQAIVKIEGDKPRPAEWNEPWGLQLAASVEWALKKRRDLAESEA